MRYSKIFAALVSCLAMGTAMAAIPGTINYQSYLTDSGGSPINDPAVTISFALYTVPAGGAPFWLETQVVGVSQGLFDVELGSIISFPAGAFETPVYLGIAVGGDPEMTPRRPISSVAYAFEADNAMTLDGQSAASLNQAAHVVDTGNPHNVTAAQAGAASSSDFSSHVVNPSAHHTRYANNEAVAAILAADGPGSSLDADLLDGLNASAFLQAGADWGRPGVSGTLFEGATALSDKYVNEGQVSSITGSMIVNNTVTSTDISFPLSTSGADVNGGLVSTTNTSAGSGGNYPMGILGQASGNPGAFTSFGVAGLAPGLGAGSPINELPVGTKYGVAGVVDLGIGAAGLSNGGAGIGVLGDGTVAGVKAVGINGPTKGYLAVQGDLDFDGEDELDIGGLEIGVLGYSAGGSTGDNYGLWGESNGIGIRAEGGILAGDFVGDVDVSGDLTTDRVTYTTPRTHYYTVSDGDFYSALGTPFSTSFGNGGTYMTVAGTQVLAAGLHLPDGAVITSFRAYVDDQAAGNLSITISRLSLSGNGFTTVASVNSSGTPGLANYVDSTISFAVVNNQTNAYHVRVFSTGWPGNSSLKIKGAVVSYTISEAD
jgi:hypothetical protein